MAENIILTCHDCAEMFEEPVQKFVDAPGPLVLAPLLCSDCNIHEEEEG